jgi:Bifunctional DNA primase/polymerase, N-terminal
MLVPIIIDGKEQRQHPCSRMTKGAIEKGWPEKATTEHKKLAEWSVLYPCAVSGVVTENFTVLDADDLQWVSANESRLPPTRVYFTARGRHYLFKPVAGLRSSTKKIAGVDIKTGPRNYVIYWPSLGLRVIDAPLAPFPESILDELLAGRHSAASLAAAELPAAAATSSPPVTSPGGVAAVFQGAENDGGENGKLSAVPRELPILLSRSKLSVHPRSREACYAHVALIHAMNELLDARPGERNYKLNVRAYSLGRLAARGWIAVEKIVHGLELVCRHNLLTRDDGLEQTMRTIASGLSAGMAKPYPDIRETEA